MRSNETRRVSDWEVRPALHQALTSPAMQAADWQEAPPPVGGQGAAHSSGRAVNLELKTPVILAEV